jgi:hypothetical protein
MVVEEIIGTLSMSKAIDRPAPQQGGINSCSVRTIPRTLVRNDDRKRISSRILYF